MKLPRAYLQSAYNTVINTCCSNTSLAASLLALWILLSTSLAWSQINEPSPLLASQTGPDSIDRTGFAAPGQLSWSPMTDFEQTLLERFISEDVFTANDLLSLYLLASGDVRNRQQVQDFQAKIDAFFERHDDILHIPDERGRGAALLQRMHHYFLRVDESTPLAGYDEDQSQLSELLRSGVYNCISSALLYLVLAETAGLTTAGVIMPSHAFVQVTLPDGRVADVETTAADGFDVVRNQAFFDRSADEWFRSRRLVVPSFADYEQRRVVSVAGLGYESLWSQHTTEARMDYADRLRLAEFRGLLQSAIPDAQHNRLVYYYREAEFLRNQNDVLLFDRLMARIDPFLAGFANVVASDLFSDPVSAVPLLLLQAERAEWRIGRGNDTDAAVTLAFDVLQQVDTAVMNVDVIRDLAYRALHTRVLSLLSSAQFAQARGLIERFPADCAESGFCINALEQYYVTHGRQYWQDSNWRRTISLYEEYLARGLQTENREVFVSNLETAYLNQAEQHWFDEERDEAESILEVCIIRAPQSQRCQQRLQAARQRR
ncbi:MAG: transglutaminase family protein [Pseudohongiella sp.]|nr:transglutaminase family protein [Pseudohongiella sp.]